VGLLYELRVLSSISAERWGGILLDESQSRVSELFLEPRLGSYVLAYFLATVINTTTSLPGLQIAGLGIGPLGAAVA
jgi:hypothetical protein